MTSTFLSKFLLFLDCHDDVATSLFSTDAQEQASGYSKLSGTYYGIYTVARAKFRKIFSPWWLLWLAPARVALWCITWLPLGAWCYWRALPLSNKMVGLVGYNGISIGMCNTRQNILFSRGKYDEAGRCIRAGLRKSPVIYTHGLLHIGLAKLHKRNGDKHNTRAEVCRAIIVAEKGEERHPLQAARIYRKCAALTDFFEVDNPLVRHQLQRRANTLLGAL